MCALSGLHVQIALPFVLEDCGVATVCKRARVAIAHASEIVFIAAKCLGDCLGLVGAMAVVDDLPNGVVLNHFSVAMVRNTPKIIKMKTI